MAKGCTNNTYEEARKQRLEENKKRFEDLGISKISKTLTGLATPEKKTQQRRFKPKSLSKNNDEVELRRSSRTRNSVASYRDDVDIELPTFRKRSRSFPSANGSYLARPLDEVKEATEDERSRAFMIAEELLSNLQSSNPTFIKSMVRSHVYSCFWLGLPTRFCKEHLPKRQCDMVLEDENGSEYEAVFIGNRTGLSGGWRGFALDHKLDDGDALVFELVEPTKFKIYIIRAFPDSDDGGQKTLEDEEDDCEAKEPTPSKKHKSQPKKTRKLKHKVIEHEIHESGSSQENQAENKVDNAVQPQGVNSRRKTRSSQKKSQNVSEDSELPADGDLKREEHTEGGRDSATEKSKDDAMMKQKSQVNKTRRSKHESVLETDDMGSTQKPESDIEIEVKTEAAGCDLKKVEPHKEASKCASQKPRKKAAPKLFRKRA